jgi:hypothetical protein
MSKTLVVIGDRQFEVNSPGYEVSQGKYAEYDVVISVLSEGAAEVSPSNSEDVELNKLLSTWDEFSEAVKHKLASKYHDGRRGWDDPTFKSNCEEKLQEHVMRQFRGGHQEVDIAAFAMFLRYLSDEFETPYNGRVADITEAKASAIKDNSSADLKPSSAGIMVEDIKEIQLKEVVEEEELMDMRRTSGILFAEAKVVQALEDTAADQILFTRSYNGINQKNIESAVDDLIKLETLKSAGKLLYIVIPPKVVFDDKDITQFKIKESVQIYEKAINSTGSTDTDIEHA